MLNVQFRKEINGLRAIAVIAVVLFHYNADWLPGGFAGVDVFFVISGFLMTGIIFRGLEQKQFSLLKFYAARANRIIPALAVLCAALLVMGWLYLTPQDYKLLGKHVHASMLFISNNTYSGEVGYFAPISQEKWLLHTWSLSIEWQFYIIYPIILLGLSKLLSLKSLKITVALAACISFILGIVATFSEPNPAYYLFQNRAWEMMLGGVAYLYPFKLSEQKKKYWEALGIGLILCSYIFISKDTPWPGYLALVPVLGAFLLIQAQRQDSVLTANAPFQYIGKWSYSIYLWHWPIFVGINFFHFSQQALYIGMLVSIVLGFMSNKYIESIKFRNDFSHLGQYIKCKPIYLMIVLASAGQYVLANGGLNNSIRLDETHLMITKQQQKNPREKECGKVDEDGYGPHCMFGEGPIGAIVVGDSHARAQVETIGELAARHGQSVLDLGLSACNSIKGLYSVDKNGNKVNANCGKFVAKSIQDVGNLYPSVPVIMINRWSQNFYGMNENPFDIKPYRFVDKEFTERDSAYRNNLAKHMYDTICEFSEHNPVYVVRSIPELKINVPKTMFVNPEKVVKISFEAYQQRQKIAYTLQDKAQKNCHIKILDPIPYLCDDKFCYGSKKGVPLYMDDDHLSKYGSEVISSIYEDIFKG